MQHFTRLELWKKAHRSRFLRYALGSATELECHLLLARDLSSLSAEGSEELKRRIDEVERMRASLVRRLEVRKGERRLTPGATAANGQ